MTALIEGLGPRTASVENTHSKITEKYNALKAALTDIGSTESTELADIRKTAALALSELSLSQIDYNLTVVGILSKYYAEPHLEKEHTATYYRAISGDNYTGKLETEAMAIIVLIYRARYILAAVTTRGQDGTILMSAEKHTSRAGYISIKPTLERLNYDICKCGTKMGCIDSTGELCCSSCGKIRSIVGNAPRDNSAEGPRACKASWQKQSSYDTSRHHRFWSERLQALENKEFDQDDIRRIRAVIVRDKYNCATITCRHMRNILKDPRVRATYLNDHVPLLVKQFGGPPPPRLDYQENKLTAIRFNKIMNLYEIVNPEGGNKPYYPYFIYKIWEEMFKDDKQKLRILNYIHLQSRETVIKNDKFYKDICELSDPIDGLVYRPTQVSTEHLE